MKKMHRVFSLISTASCLAMPFSLSLTSCGKTDYSIPLELPALKITTDDLQPITSKTEYKTAKIVLNNTQQSYCLDNVTARVRGRGQASWAEAEKKSYRINFDAKTSIFGSNKKFKKWNLISNYFDRSLLRNYMAYYLCSKLDNTMFSPSVHNVDLYINNEYYGVYMITDAVEVKEGRVNIDDSIEASGDNGYLLEQNKADRLEDKKLDQDYFIASNNIYFEIKSPDTTSTEYLDVKDAEIAYIKSYINNCFSALDGNNWQSICDLIDPNSFANGYIMQELFANLDCSWCSMYYYKDKGEGKLKYGPIWDFDFSSGNCQWVESKEKQSPDKALWANKNCFFNKLLNFDEFRNIVIKKLDDFKPAFIEAMKLLDINDSSSIYKTNEKALERNFKKWKLLGVEIEGSTNEIKNIRTLSGQISFLKDWLEKRYTYLLTIYKN